MNFMLHFLPEVEEDIFIGFAWYEEKALGLGEEFKRMYYSCVAEIARNLFLYPKVYGEFRRCLLRRFPYVIYFIVEETGVVVCGFFHCARDPGVIKKQVRDRKEYE